MCLSAQSLAQTLGFGVQGAGRRVKRSGFGAEDLGLAPGMNPSPEP